MNETSGTLPIRVAASSHRGRRENNEDSVYGATYKTGAVRALLAVADGMGGHQAGEVASRMAIDTLLSSLKDRLRKQAGRGRLDAPAVIQDIAEEINGAVRDAAGGLEERRGMGSTLCFALVTDSGFLVGNIGDSRAYIIRAEEIRQVSIDHTAYSEMIRSGKVSKEVAARNPYAHHITRSIGGSESPQVDVFPEGEGVISLEDGDVLLLCSDGLVNTVRDEEIMEQVRGTENLSVACHNLVSLAYMKGGTDNISLVAAEVGTYPRSGMFLESFPAIDSFTRALVVRERQAEVRVRRLKTEILVLILLLVFVAFFIFVMLFLSD